MVSESQYQALERWYLNLNTILSREGGTENLLPCSREEVVPKFQYHALEGPWYLNFSTEHSRDGGIYILVPWSPSQGWYLDFVTKLSMTDISIPGCVAHKFK